MRSPWRILSRDEVIHVWFMNISTFLTDYPLQVVMAQGGSAVKYPPAAQEAQDMGVRTLD